MMKKRLSHKRFKRFVSDVYTHTPLTRMVLLLMILWLGFATGIYLAEQNVSGATITGYSDALYWGVAAFSTAGIADTPTSGLAQLIGGVWIVIGSILFFGTIVATVTSYFMRPMQRPHKKIIETIEYNLEQLDNLEIEELDLLRNTVDTLIKHVEQLKARHSKPDAEQ
ncbi:MAG: two pore domain potassium channel family protein [Pseudomonadota bacterium]|nr:two pore domain potassium channel family protein [Pseudomonadota bacterium]